MRSFRETGYAGNPLSENTPSRQLSEKGLRRKEADAGAAAPRSSGTLTPPALRRTMVEATRPVVEGQLAQHPRQHPGRRGWLAEPGTPGGLLVGVGRLDAVGGRRRGSSRAGPALSARLRVLGSDARWASHAPPLSVPLSRRGRLVTQTYPETAEKARLATSVRAKVHAEGNNFREHPPSRHLSE